MPASALQKPPTPKKIFATSSPQQSTLSAAVLAPGHCSCSDATIPANGEPASCARGLDIQSKVLGRATYELGKLELYRTASGTRSGRRLKKARSWPRSKPKVTGCFPDHLARKFTKLPRTISTPHYASIPTAPRASTATDTRRQEHHSKIPIPDFCAMTDCSSQTLVILRGAQFGARRTSTNTPAKSQQLRSFAYPRRIASG